MAVRHILWLFRASLCCAGIVGSIPEEAPATQDYDATLRLGLDSTFGNHGLSPQPMLRQHLEAGSRSLPAGALSRANAAAFRMALTQPMSVSDAQLGYQATSAAANQLFAASSPADASAALALQGLDFGAATSRMGQELVKGELIGLKSHVDSNPATQIGLCINSPRQKLLPTWMYKAFPLSAVC